MTTTTETDVRTAIQTANRAFMTAFKSRDAGAIAKLYTTGAQLLPPNSDAIGGEAGIRDFWQGAMNLGVTEALLETVDVDAAGATVIETGRYRLLAGGTALDSGKYLVVWKNDAGSWKLHRDIWNTSQPQAASR